MNERSAICLEFVFLDIWIRLIRPVNCRNYSFPRTGPNLRLIPGFHFVRNMFKLLDLLKKWSIPEASKGSVGNNILGQSTARAGWTNITKNLLVRLIRPSG